jgi:hypothetical protein
MKIKRIIGIFCTFCACFGGFLVAGNEPVKLAAPESRTATFNEMVVRHAKRLCNGGLHNVFSQDGRDFVDFWFTANEVNLDLEKAYTCLRLFYNNIKSCEVIDYTVVDQVLDASPKLFERYFEINPARIGSLNIVRENVEDLMLTRFTNKFDNFQATPDLFLSRLSADVTNIVKSRLQFIQQEEEEREFRAKLRNITIRFADTMINKTLWYEHEYERIWPSFLSIADNLHKLGTRGIITDQDNLDELWDSLTRRFVWYLDCKGSLLPVGLYEQIEEDLKNNVVFFLEADEQDDGIIRKKEMVQQAVVRAKAKAIAHEKGLVTDQAVAA